MKDEQPQENSIPPVSRVAGIAGQLFESGLMSAPLNPGEIGSLDHYKVLSVIGEGGMGIVLKAEDSRDGSQAAIKILRPELAEQPKLVTRFLGEVGLMQSVKHPHIMPVLYVSPDREKPYFVMPLMEGGSLLEKINRERRLTESQSVAIARQVAEALAHAHVEGMYHRDLKPGNVLLDSAGNAYLADFGLARTVYNDSVGGVAQGGKREGTAHYMSPQIANGEAEDTRCDTYAVGALLYEMLTGRPPYDGASVEEILEKIKAGPPAPILSLRPGVSPGLVTVVEGAMAREQRDRYANMRDLLTDLKRIEKGEEPTGPHTPLSLRQLVREKKRQLGWAAAACAVIALGMVALDRHRMGYALTPCWNSLPDAEVNWTAARMGDWDGDGERDFATVKKDKLVVISERGQQIASRPFGKVDGGEIFRLNLLADINGDGIDEALVGWNTGPTARITAFNKEAWPVKEFQFQGTTSVNPYFGTNHTCLVALRVVDLNGDGRRELLARVESTWALRPRGICCFDVETQELKWFFETANFITDVELCDLDGDSRQELVLGSNSPGNYPEAYKLDDGTDDQHVYVYVVSSDGKLRWRRELGGVFTSIRPLRVNPDRRGVTVWVSKEHNYSQAHGEPDTGKIVEFDAQGTVVNQHDFGIQLCSAMVTKFEGNGRRQVLACDRLGFLHVLDAGLTEQRSVQVSTNRFTEVNLRILDAGPLGQSGAAHLVLGSSQFERQGEPWPGNQRETVPRIFSHDNRLIVLDAELRPVANLLLAEKSSLEFQVDARFTPGKAGRPAELVILTDKAAAFSLVKTRHRWFAGSVP